MNEFGFSSLLTFKNKKIEKSNAAGSRYLSALMHLAPAKSAGGQNVCASASPGCIAACLHTSGHGRYQRVQDARIVRTRFYLENREKFKEMLRIELQKFEAKSKKKGLMPAIRLNGTSDIVWEKVWPELFTEFPNIQFYDYTKHVKRCLKGWKLPANYHLTFSRSENNQEDCDKVLAAGICNVAVVAKSKPSLLWGHKTFSMDETDLRFLDPKGVGLLTPKGRAKYDKSGFVVE